MEVLAEVGDFYSCVWANSSVSPCYSSRNALVIGWGCVGFFAFYSFVASILGNNCSKVDQLWSILPVFYSWHFYYHGLVNGVANDRIFLISVLITLWGLRLTFNFWRKGGYGNLIHHEEDYRWPIIRKKMNPLQFFIFNLTFIATYQNILLYMITIPIYQISLRSNTNLTTADVAFAGLFLVFFVLETVADEQHWRFQQLKYSLTPEARSSHPSKDIVDGFYRSGLFRYSRHPNYFGEQSMWVTVYLFTCPDFGLLNWTLAGALQLILLFQGSMNFAEQISSAKYPRYKEYQATTSQCIPWFPAGKRKNA